MTSLLAALVLLSQEPSPPGVRVPKGWRVDYWGRTQSGRGGIIGPEGQEIGFPDYEETGQLAASISLLEPYNLYVGATLAGRHVDVALGSDGLVAVSFGKADPYVHYSSSTFDYWMKRPTGRQAAQMLAIVLTRADFWKEGLSPQVAGSATGKEPGVAPPTLHRPFESSGKPLCVYTLRRGPGHGPAGIWFEKIGAATVESREDLPASPKWVERVALLDGELVIQEGKDGRLAARFAPPGAPRTSPSHPVFTARESTPATTILATFATLTYVETKP